MVGECGAGAGFFSCNFRRPLSLSFCAPIFHSHLIIIGVLPVGQAGVAWEPSNKTLFCRLSGSTGQSSILTLFLCLQSVNNDVSAMGVARNWIDLEYGYGAVVPCFKIILFQNYLTYLRIRNGLSLSVRIRNQVSKCTNTAMTTCSWSADLTCFRSVACYLCVAKEAWFKIWVIYLHPQMRKIL
jgi:hypothetical protein